MDQLPKIVRERLRQGAPDEHPGTEVLAAFVEHSLGEWERQHVVEHLSRCVACRETVLLATPEAEREAAAVAAAAIPAAADRKRASVWRWARWPALGWAATALCVVVLAAAVLVRRERRATRIPAAPGLASLQAARRTGQPSGAQAEPVRKRPSKAGQAPGIASRLGARAAALGRGEPSDKLARQASGAEAGRAGGVEGAAAKEGGPASTATRTLAPARVAAGLGPAAKISSQAHPNLGTGQGAGYGPALARDAQAVAAPAGVAPPEAPNATGSENATPREKKSTEAQAVPAAPAQLKEVAPAILPERAPSVSGGVSAGAGAGIGGGVAGAGNEKSLPNAPRWSLTDDGALERSVDSGKTWTKVDVGNGTTFHAISVSGVEIWAGGADGVLFHSLDGGLHWRRVRPAAEGVTLSAAIVRIEFSDARHGRLVTESGEIWSTSDGGEMWQRH